MTDVAELLALIDKHAPDPTLSKIGLTAAKVRAALHKPGRLIAPPPGLTSRPAILRLAKITARLRLKRPFTASQLAQECGTCRKTIARDLAWLRKSMGYPISWNAQRGCYVLAGNPPTPVL